MRGDTKPEAGLRDWRYSDSNRETATRKRVSSGLYDADLAFHKQAYKRLFSLSAAVTRHEPAATIWADRRKRVHYLLGYLHGQEIEAIEHILAQQLDAPIKAEPGLDAPAMALDIIEAFSGISCQCQQTGRTGIIVRMDTNNWAVAKGPSPQAVADRIIEMATSDQDTGHGAGPLDSALKHLAQVTADWQKLASPMLNALTEINRLGLGLKLMPAHWLPRNGARWHVLNQVNSVISVGTADRATDIPSLIGQLRQTPLDPIQVGEAVPAESIAGHGALPWTLTARGRR